MDNILSDIDEYTTLNVFNVLIIMSNKPNKCQISQTQL